MADAPDNGPSAFLFEISRFSERFAGTRDKLERHTPIMQQNIEELLNTARILADLRIESC